MPGERNWLLDGERKSDDVNSYIRSAGDGRFSRSQLHSYERCCLQGIIRGEESRGVSSGQGRHRLGNTIVSMLWDMKRRESFKESLACGKVSEGGEL